MRVKNAFHRAVTPLGVALLLGASAPLTLSGTAEAATQPNWDCQQVLPVTDARVQQLADILGVQIPPGFAYAGLICSPQPRIPGNPPTYVYYPFCGTGPAFNELLVFGQLPNGKGECP